MTSFQAIGGAWNALRRSPSALWIPVQTAVLAFAIVAAMALSGMVGALSPLGSRLVLPRDALALFALLLSIVLAAGPFFVAAIYGSFADVAEGVFRPADFWRNGARRYAQGCKAILSILLTTAVCGLASLLVVLVFAGVPVLAQLAFVALALAWVVVGQAIVLLGPVVFLFDRSFLGDIGTAFRIARRHWWTLLGIEWWTGLIDLAVGAVAGLLVPIPVLGWLIYALLTSGSAVLTTLCYWVYCGGHGASGSGPLARPV